MSRRVSTGVTPTVTMARVGDPAPQTAYITVEQLKASLTLSNETYADADITLAINAASRQVDAQCHRRFTLDVDNTSQRIYPRLSHIVDIDDVVDVQTVELGPGNGAFPISLTVDTDYELAPLNAPADSEPFTTIRLLHQHRQRNWHGRVRVTGQFGWTEVPDLVTGATSLLAGRLLRRIREAPFGIVTIGLDGAPARIAQTDPDIAAMLIQLTKLLVR